MSKYKVTISESYYLYKTIEVEADSYDEAESKAIDINNDSMDSFEVGDLEFDGQDVVGSEEIEDENI